MQENMGFLENKEYDKIREYLAFNNLTIREILYEYDSITPRGVIIRNYMYSYKKPLYQSYLDYILFLEVNYFIGGKLEYDITSNKITHLYTPFSGLYGFDSPAILKSSSITGSITNNGYTASHTLTMEISMIVSHDLFDVEVKMPTLVEVLNYSPGAN